MPSLNITITVKEREVRQAVIEYLDRLGFVALAEEAEPYVYRKTVGIGAGETEVLAFDGYKVAHCVQKEGGSGAVLPG